MKSGNKNDHKPRLITIADIILVIALIITAIVFIPFMRANTPETVVVYRVDEIIAEYPLNEDRKFFVEGIIGTIGVEIKDNRVCVHYAHCPQQVCVETGWITESYQQIVCAPNLIFVRIKSGREDEEIDAVSN